MILLENIAHIYESMNPNDHYGCVNIYNSMHVIFVYIITIFNTCVRIYIIYNFMYTLKKKKKEKRINTYPDKITTSICMK